MTIKEKLLEFRRLFPFANYSALGRLAGCENSTAQFHLDAEYRAKHRTRNRGWLNRRAERNKILLVDFLGGGCYECGYQENIRALDFHHRDPSQKLAQITNLLSGKIENMIEEARKCVLLCCRCHRELHAKES